MRCSLRSFPVLLLLLLCPLLVPAAETSRQVRIGVLAWQGLEEAEVRWSTLMNQLADQLPGRALVLRHFDLAGVAAALKAGELDFVVTNPGHYVFLEAESGISRIATLVADNASDPAHVVGSAVVVLADRQDIQALADLEGRSLAAVSPDAFGGYQVAWGELRRQGLDPEQGRPKPVFTGFPMSRVVEAVLNGDADAGVLRVCLLERLERDGALRPGQLRVLSPRPGASPCQASAPLYPGWAFAAAPDTPPALSRDVLVALLALTPDAAGQSWSVPADYHPVHELLRALQIGPYAFLRETAWPSLWERYWPWVCGLVLALLAGGAYTLHVEHLVQRRTRELTQAMAARQRLEVQVREGQQQMDHLSRLSVLGELSGTLAHELNQPLATIGNYARSLLRRQDSGSLAPAALRQAAEEIASESERAAGILGGIRALARKRNRVREAHDPAVLVGDAGRLFAGMLPGVPELQVCGRCDDLRVWVDPLQIQQVLLNLFKNAWDAQQAAACGAPIQVELERAGDRCIVAVRDHGPGLAPEMQGRLFEAFFTTKPDGLGLGLSICKTIVEAHGGDLSASAPASGKGLVVRFSLPLADAGNSVVREPIR
ncbi:sensor histidine kinase [Zoogloea sp.]|uniref:sensor histidine kinase n=1 Tax=Zoogloea sp. TaxID=49181 RepID=UPI0025FB96E3|nr:sensor histidine kinase [Zoogloea sp.]MCK6393669.1 PhnD/SsuA/transferrin family substrate-binding protein [Zoogloea sp.]